MPDIYNRFEPLIGWALRAATHSLPGLKVLSDKPETDASGWKTWKLVWETRALEGVARWDIAFSAHPDMGDALAWFTPEGWTAPGLHSSAKGNVGKSIREWENFDARDLLKAGIQRAAKYRYFQKGVREKWMSAARVAARWETRRADLPAAAFVQVDKSAIFFWFEVMVPQVGVAKMFFERHVAAAMRQVEAAVAVLNNTFGGKSKFPNADTLQYAVEGGRLVITGPAPAATGVFNLDVHAAIGRAGGAGPFKKAVVAAFAKVGWAVKNVEVPW